MRVRVGGVVSELQNAGRPGGENEMRNCDGGFNGAAVWGGCGR